jgi:hypothetical protein
MFDTTKELNIDQPLTHDLLPRSSGRFGGSTIVRHAGNMSGAEVESGRHGGPIVGHVHLCLCSWGSREDRCASRYTLRLDCLL